MADIKPIYKKTGGEWVKQDAFQRITGKWVQISSREGGEPSGEPVGYLYGHVAQEGEFISIIINGVDYAGAVLPKLPEWDMERYPFVTIDVSAPSSINAAMFAEYTPTETKLGNGSYTPSMEYADYLFGSFNGYKWSDNYFTWSEITQKTDGFNYSNEIFWTNTPIVDVNGDTIIGKCPDPIPVYRLITYKVRALDYCLLPEWDMEKFPYALIANNNGVYTLYCFSVPPAPINSSNHTLVPENDGDVGTYISATVGVGGSNTFSEPASFTEIEETASQEFIWTTYWLAYKEGGKCLETSRLTCVYE